MEVMKPQLQVDHAIAIIISVATTPKIWPEQLLQILPFMIKLHENLPKDEQIHTTKVDKVTE